MEVAERLGLDTVERILLGDVNYFNLGLNGSLSALVFQSSLGPFPITRGDRAYPFEFRTNVVPDGFTDDELQLVLDYGINREGRFKISFRKWHIRTGKLASGLRDSYPTYRTLGSLVRSLGSEVGVEEELDYTAVRYLLGIASALNNVGSVLQRNNLGKRSNVLFVVDSLENMKKPYRVQRLFELRGMVRTKKGRIDSYPTLTTELFPLVTDFVYSMKGKLLAFKSAEELKDFVDENMEVLAA